MPRPGPRPYECVRRAWHSERHQPMRGLIIQQIFRLVHDNHSAASKKNKEWLEKLPVVVLKAEEIMYSKANSEAEYSNLETLWDRVNDAVDTIIRKDESVENGELLPPCVEAALNLGCVPIRASRSQRHNNPRTYLRPYQECTIMSTQFPNDSVNECNHDLIPAQTTTSSMLKIPQNSASSQLFRDCNNRIAPNPTACTHGFEVDHRALWLGFREAQRSDSVIVGVPVFSSVDEDICLQNLFPHDEDMNAGKRSSELATDDNKGKGTQVGFDLSLRLGTFSDSNPSREKGSCYVTDSLCHSLSPYENLPIEKEFSFFPMESAHSLPRFHTSENQNTELVSRKRKLDVGKDQIFLSQDSTYHFVGEMRRHGM